LQSIFHAQGTLTDQAGLDSLGRIFFIEVTPHLLPKSKYRLLAHTHDLNTKSLFVRSTWTNSQFNFWR